jgi:hypothetical protein
MRHKPGDRSAAQAGCRFSSLCHGRRPAWRFPHRPAHDARRAGHYPLRCAVVSASPRPIAFAASESGLPVRGRSGRFRAADAGVVGHGASSSSVQQAQPGAVLHLPRPTLGPDKRHFRLSGGWGRMCSRGVAHTPWQASGYRPCEALPKVHRRRGPDRPALLDGSASVHADRLWIRPTVDGKFAWSDLTRDNPAPARGVLRR